MQQNTHKIIVVLGMHRGGTSAVTRGLQALGVNLGDKFLPPKKDNITGFWEDVDLNALNIEMINFLKQDWHFLKPFQSSDMDKLYQAGYPLRAVELLHNKTSNVQLFGFKDPRVTKLLPFWKEVFTQSRLGASYVIIVRHPLSVCKSLEKRHGFDFEKSSLLWLEHVISSLTTTNGEDRVLVDYDQLIQSPETVLYRIAKELQLQINLTELDKFKTDFLDKKLRHSTFQIEDLNHNTSIPMLVKEVYATLAKVTNDELPLNDQNLQERFIQWDVEFLRSTQALSLADKLESRLITANSELANLTVQISNLTTSLAIKDNELAIKDNELSARVNELSAIHTSKAWRLITLYRKALEALRGSAALPKALFRKTTEAMEKVLNYWRAFGFRTLLAKLFSIIISKLVSFPRTLFNVLQEYHPRRGIRAETLESASTGYEQWITENEPKESALNLQKISAHNFKYKPLISVVVPVFNTPDSVLCEMIDSVRSQTYENWELCISNGSASNQTVSIILDEYARKDQRIKVKHMNANLGISGNSNEALGLATGEFIALLDHDDTLAPFALFDIAELLNQQPDLDFIYSDKDMIDESGKKRFLPLFKPDWSPDMMLSVNYLTHLCVIRHSLVNKIGGFHQEMDGAQDWDLFLRIVESSNRIAHISRVLYHWRQISTSVSSGITAKPYALQAQIATIQESLQRRGKSAEAYHIPPGFLRVVWPVTGKNQVSIVIATYHTKWNQLSTVINKISSLTDYPNVEFVVVGLENNNIEPNLTTNHGHTIKLVPSDGTDNILRLYNRGYKISAGDLILFLNEDLLPISNGWLHEMVRWIELDGVGAAGGLLLNRDNNIAYTGLVRFNNHLHPLFSGEKTEAIHFSPFGEANWIRNFSALSPDCIMISRNTMETLGPFDEHQDAINGTANLCTKIISKGSRITYTPYACFQYQKQQMVKPMGYTASTKIGNAYSLQGGEDRFFNSNLTLNENMPKITVGHTNSGQNITTTKRNKTAQKLDLGAWEQYSIDAAVLTSQFDFSSRDLASNYDTIARNQGQIDIKKVMWFLPNFGYAFYGGIHTIFRFASYLSEKHHVEHTFTILGAGNIKKIRSLLEENFPHLSKQSILFIRPDDIDRLPFSDACFATLWTTAYVALKYNQTRRKFYFIQDFEPLFYPAGSTFAQVEATYRFGFYGITNTISLKRTYENEYGGSAEYFTPSVDRDVFFPSPNRIYNKKSYKLFFYGRPGHPRNAFELGTQALKILKNRFRDQVEIVTAGSEWDPGQFGLKNVVKNLGLLSYSQTGQLYRECDLGMVMMFTRHPSYLPFELMACGCVVVTNFNQYTSWLLKDGENCLLSNASATSIAETVERALVNPERRRQITVNANNMIEKHYSDWDIQFKKLHRYMENEKRNLGN